MAALDGSSILITGGTGSLGRSLVKKILTETSARRIAVYSRDELKQLQLKEEFSGESKLRLFIGDIRDKDRLCRAMHGVDYVIHAAALKQVDTGEYNPFEFIKTNVLGSQNVIEASIDSKVKKVVALSTDKASSPINLYGATKLTADKLFIAANNYSQAYGTAFSVVRYGNVMGSRGSVIPFFKKLVETGQPLPVTDKLMTRFWISLQQAVNFVIDTFEIMQGGELFVPRIPSMKLLDLVTAIAPGHPIIEVGIRPGEKLHEEMISEDDSRRTFLKDDRYTIKPLIAEWGFKDPVGIPMEIGFSYKSNTNDTWMTVSEMKKFIDDIEG